MIFRHAEVFPTVARVVREEYRKHQRFVTHDELVQALTKEPEIQKVVNRLSTSRRNLRGPRIVSNIVQWFSQQITVGRSEYAPFFDRQKIGGDWAYRPITAEQPVGADPDLEAIEGEPRLVAHLSRERNPALAKRKKEQVLLLSGKIACEACDFEFAKVYPVLGENFCEVHHVLPIGQASKQGVVKLSDLAILCANCHRMIHRTRPIDSIHDFRRRLARPPNTQMEPTRALAHEPAAYLERYPRIEQMDMLTTTIKRLWLREIIAERKKVEYREIKPYWKKRFDTVKAPFLLRLINGMQKNAPEATVEVVRVRANKSQNRYELTIGKIVNTKNWDKRRETPAR